KKDVQGSREAGAHSAACPPRRLARRQARVAAARLPLSHVDARRLSRGLRRSHTFPLQRSQFARELRARKTQYRRNRRHARSRRSPRTLWHRSGKERDGRAAQDGSSSVPHSQRTEARRVPEAAVLVPTLPGVPESRGREIRLVEAQSCGWLNEARWLDFRLGNGGRGMDRGNICCRSQSPTAG